MNSSYECCVGTTPASAFQNISIRFFYYYYYYLSFESSSEHRAYASDSMFIKQRELASN